MFELVKSFGCFGNENGNFNSPSHIAIDSNDRTYVADTNNHRIQIFDQNGEFKNKFGEWDDGFCKFKYPYGIAVYSSSDDGIRIAISDEHNHRIQVFDSDGKFINEVGMWGEFPGGFKFPKGIAFSGGKIFVADNSNHRIQVFDENLRYVRQFGVFGSEFGKFKFPIDVMINSNNRVIVVDNQNHRLQFLKTNGIFIASIGKFGSNIGEFNSPGGIAINKDNLIFVCDTYNHRIQVFDSDGIFIECYGSFGSGDNEFNCPTGIAIDSKGQIIVADTLNHRIKILKIELEFELLENPHVKIIEKLSKQMDENPNLYYAISLSGGDIVESSDSEWELLNKIRKKGREKDVFIYCPIEIYLE